MINNSSSGRWHRLENKSLDCQFTNELIEGLNCSPFEATAVLETVYKLYGCYFEEATSLAPGQIRLHVLATEAPPGHPVAKAKQTTVTLTLNNDQEDLKIRRTQGVVGLRRHKLERVCREAFDQGGLLTVEDLAYRIFNCGERTICRDLVYFREQGIFIPLRSTVKDIGRSLSHRLWVIRLWAEGKDYSEIARRACHSLSAIQHYVDKFKRVIALSKAGYDTPRIAFLVKLSTALVEQYLQLYQRLDFIEHRAQELMDLAKKTVGTAMPQEVRL